MLAKFFFFQYFAIDFVDVFLFRASQAELQVKISNGHVKLQIFKHISVLCTSKRSLQVRQVFAKIPKS